MLLHALVCAAACALRVPRADRAPAPMDARARAAAVERPATTACGRRAAAGGVVAAWSLASSGAARAAGDGLAYVPVARDVSAKPTLAYRAVEARSVRPGLLLTREVSRRTSLSRRYGLRFVEYVARLLLNYDAGSRAWWEGRRRGAAAEPSPEAKEARRYAAYAEFVSSVELGIARSYLRDDGLLFEALADRVLPRTIAARRQLALLGALSTTPLRATTAAVARSTNGTLVDVVLNDRGSGYDAKKPPAVTVVDPYPKRFADAAPARVSATLRPSGRVYGVTVVDGGAGYDASDPPAVRVYRTAGRSEADAAPARCRAVVDAAGAVAAVVLEAPGAGYDPRSMVTLVIASPPPAFAPPAAAATAPAWLRAFRGR